MEGIVRIARPLSLYLWLCYIIKKIITNLLKRSIFKFQLEFTKLASMVSVDMSKRKNADANTSKKNGENVILGKMIYIPI